MFDPQNITRRFNIVLCLILLSGIIIAAKVVFIMLQKDFWNEVASFQVRTNIPIAATRGNIISDNGELLVCNHVKYNIFI